MDVYVARENGYIGYIVDIQRLKRLHRRLQKVTSVTLLKDNYLGIKKRRFNDILIAQRSTGYDEGRPAIGSYLRGGNIGRGQPASLTIVLSVTTGGFMQ